MSTIPAPNFWRLDSRAQDRIRAITAGQFQGRYWADRAVADIYEKTGVRLTVRSDRDSSACTIEPPPNFYQVPKE